MKNIWVYRHDGSIQCTDVMGESVKQAREDLASIIGEKEILNGEKRYLPMIRLCGLPTGAVNAFEITHAGWILLTTGFVGPAGFERWPDKSIPFRTKENLQAAPAGGGEVPFPFSTERADIPLSAVLRTLVCPPTGNDGCQKDLAGRPLRVYKIGDMLTMDWRPTRVNIGLNDRGLIEDVWFG